MRPRSLAVTIVALLALLAGCAALPPSQVAGAVRMYSFDGSQVEIFSPGGTRVLVDVANLYELTSPADATRDVMLTTHNHPCAYQYNKGFEGRRLMIEPGTLEVGDVRITGIASSNTETPVSDPLHAGNYIYLIETGGMRIVHFGTLGQAALTEAQLQAIGRVDLAVAQLANSESHVSIVNKRGFMLMDQVRPSLIIPSHYDLPTARYAVQHWPGAYAPTNEITLERGALPGQPTVVFIGDGAKSIGALLGAPPLDVALPEL